MDRLRGRERVSVKYDGPFDASQHHNVIMSIPTTNSCVTLY